MGMDYNDNTNVYRDCNSNNFTTSGTVFNAFLLSSSSSNNTNTVISEIIRGIIGIAINVAVVYYLYRPNVKAYFGKARTPEIK
jgi:hypothetical protein